MTRRINYSFLASVAMFACLLGMASFAYAEETDADATVSTNAAVAATTTAKTRFNFPKNLLDNRKEEERERKMTRDASTSPQKPMPAVKEMREERKDAMQEKKENLEERRNEMKENRKDMGVRGRENAVLKIKLNIERFEKLLTAAIEREEKLISRIQSRTDKLSAEGKDVSKVTAQTTIATNELASAKTDLAAIETALSGDVNVSASTTPADVFKGTRETIQSAQQHIRAAHQAIMEAVKELKAVAGVEAKAEVESENDN